MGRFRKSSLLLFVDTPKTRPKDYAISIATIHHLATVERRVTAVKVRSTKNISLTTISNK